MCNVIAALIAHCSSSIVEFVLRYFPEGDKQPEMGGICGSNEYEQVECVEKFE